MKNKEKALNLLGLAQRAGKLVTGEEFVINDVRADKMKLVFVATNASDNTRKKLTDKCSYYEVPCVLEFSQEELSHAIGKHRMICGVTDAGFAKKLKELIQS